MAKGNAGPEKVILLWHLSTIVGTVFSISFLNLSSKEPPTDLNLYQSLGCLILFHLFGLISMKFYATRLSKPSGSDKTKRQSSSFYILNCTLIDMGFLLASIFIFHTLITLLGASPVETFALSCLLTLLTVANLVSIKPPLSVTEKLQINKSKRSTFAKTHILDRVLLSVPFRIDNEIENFVISNGYIVIAAAWLCAFPIKLDWNEPWQQFPVTCFLGAVIANSVSHCVQLGRTGVKCFLS